MEAILARVSFEPTGGFARDEHGCRDVAVPHAFRSCILININLRHFQAESTKDVPRQIFRTAMLFTEIDAPPREVGNGADLWASKDVKFFRKKWGDVDQGLRNITQLLARAQAVERNLGRN